MSLKRPIAIDSSSASLERPFPRGVSLPRKSEAMRVLLTAIAEYAAGQCGVCEAPLLAHWGWCPSCGTEVDWDG